MDVVDVSGTTDEKCYELFGEQRLVMTHIRTYDVLICADVGFPISKGKICIYFYNLNFHTNGR